MLNDPRGAGTAAPVPLRGVACPAPPAEIFGPVRAVSLLGACRDAVYAKGTNRATGREFLVAVVSATAVRLPGAVVLPGRAGGRHLADLLGDGGDQAYVGGGSVTIGRLWVTVSDVSPPRIPLRRSAGSAQVAAAMSAIAARAGAALGALAPDFPAAAGTGLPGGGAAAAQAGLTGRSAALAAAAVAADPAAATGAAWALLGYGPGLTPAGDDVLAGHLVAARWLGLLDERAYLRPVAAAVNRAAATRTTFVSRSLLRHAASGRAAPEVADLLDAVATGGCVRAALEAVLALGHTSGAALALGIATAAGVTPGGEVHRAGRRAAGPPAGIAASPRARAGAAGDRGAG